MGSFHWVWQNFTTHSPVTEHRAVLTPLGPWARQADGVPSWDDKGVEGEGNGKGAPSAADYGIWESVISSPSGVRGGAPAEKRFWYIFSLKEHMAKNCLEYGGMSPAPFGWIGSATDGDPFVNS